MNPLEANTSFLYLDRTITYNNIYWSELYRNLQKYQRIWGMVDKFLGEAGAPIKSCAMVYKAVFLWVILYGRKIWVVIDAMMTVI